MPVTDIELEGVYENGIAYFYVVIELPQDADIMAGISAELEAQRKKYDRGF